MAARLSGYLGYLAATSRSEGLRGATRARRARPRERGGASLLVDRASHVLTAAAIARSVEHAIGDPAGGMSDGKPVGLLHGAGQLDEAGKDAA